MAQAAESLKAAVYEAQEALRAADLDARSQLRVVRALEKVVAAHEQAGTEPEHYEDVKRSLEERRRKLTEIAERSLTEAAEGDDQGELQGTLAGAHQVLSELAPERAEKAKSRAGELGQQPFFSRFLERQDDPSTPITMKAPSDKEDTPTVRQALGLVTRKFPSDWEDSVGGGKKYGEPHQWVTLKYPSDDDEVFTLKFPSDSDEPTYG